MFSLNGKAIALNNSLLIDIGANLTHKQFHGDLDAVLARAQQAQVGRIIVTGTSVEESLAALQLAVQNPNLLSSTAGVHPHAASHWHADVRKQIYLLAQADQVVAVGECGLDFNRDFSPRDKQETCFAAQLELAQELQLPVFLHERDAFERFAAILGIYCDKIPGAVVHCFTGSEKALKHYLDLGCHIGITGWVCDERRGDELRKLVNYIPADRLMVETDAPYLLPRTIKPKPKGGRNEPALLAHVVEALAVIRGVSFEDLAKTTSDTARNFFHL